jgi:predicted RND superfamily exporter protein
MDTFITDLVTIDAIVTEPEFFWLRDFRKYVSISSFFGDVTNKTFDEQVSMFLSNPLFYKLYGDHIVRDESGTILASRCQIYMDQINIYDVKDQVKTLKDQLSISKSQPVNQGLGTLKFFTYGGDYNIWEFFYRVTREIGGQTISSIAAVTFVTLIIIPHWSATLFAFPLICMLYVDFLGMLQWSGVKVNPVSYVTIVMSIGLLVDYLLHVLLRYYETPGNRKEKVQEVLRSMGSSVLMGGITTFLGTIPLAFSSSEIFTTIFIAFISLVVLVCDKYL